LGHAVGIGGEGFGKGVAVANALEGEAAEATINGSGDE
jgi:hypothetical protein